MSAQSERYNSTFALMTDSLDLIANLQAYLIGQFLDTKTIIFYAVALLFSIALTSTTRTFVMVFPCKSIYLMLPTLI